MTDLKTAAQQALEAMDREIDTRRCKASTLRAMIALRAALAQQAEQAWVCPDSAEHRYAKPGHCEDCGKTLVQEQGCEHCNHPLYAATKCRVCGRVTEQAEPVEPVAWVRLEAWKSGQSWPDDCFTALPAEGLTPLYTAPPQRQPLTEGALMGVYIDFDRAADTAWSGVEYLLRLCRAVERAHNITDPQVADRLARHGIPMPGDPK